MNKITELARRIIPKRYRALVRYIYMTIRYFGFRFKCPCCGGQFSKFLPYGVKLRPNAKCPRCDSVERHRLLWLYLRDRTDFFANHLKVLDVAPLPFFQEKCKKLKNLTYVSVDIESPTAMIKMDITNIDLPDNQFDCIICYHVLEHIIDDEKAMRELFRVLKPRGWAILQSPVDYSRDKTFESPNIVSPEERERVFGQMDHVRIYGRDYLDRLEKAGFTVKPDNYVKDLSDDKIKKYGLMKDEIMFFCTKPIPKMIGRATSHNRLTA